MEKTNDQELLKYVIENDMIDLSHIREQINMNRRKELLQKHPYKIWNGTDNKWHTYLPDEKKGRVPRKRSSKKEIEDVIIAYWEKIAEKPKTVYDSYVRWRQVHDETLSNNSIVKYNSDFKRFFEGTDFFKKPIESINQEDIEMFIVKTVKQKKLCKKACKTLFGYIKNTIQSARINKIITDNPMEFLEEKQFYKFCEEKKRSEEKTVISDERMMALYQQFLEDYEKQPFYIPTYAVHLAALTGMRVGELAALRWDSITEEYIIIDKSEKYDRSTKEYFIDSTKNEKERIFPITQEISELLNKIKNSEMKAGYICEWVFANENGRIHAPVISSCLKNKCKQIGITEVGIHAYRRTLNSKMKCDGVSTTVAASLLGHTEEVNDKYYTFDVTDIKNKATIVAHINKEMVSGK